MARIVFRSATRNGQELTMPSSGIYERGNGRILDERPATVSMILILLILAVCLLAPLFTPYGSNEMDLDDIARPPSAAHILGTDELGRDLFTRLLYGGRFTLLVAFLSVATGALTGILLGSVAGWFGGVADRFVTASIDLFLSIPVFLVLLVAASAGAGKIWIIPLVIGGTSWMETARLVRSGFRQIRGEEFVVAARSIGAGDAGVVFRHILPQAVAPVIVSATAGFANAMLIESSLSFLGFGVQPPLPTWGNMLQNAQVLLRSSPVAAFAPGFMIFITSLSFNMAGAGIKRFLAPEEE